MITRPRSKFDLDQAMTGYETYHGTWSSNKIVDGKTGTNSTVLKNGRHDSEPWSECNCLESICDNGWMDWKMIESRDVVLSWWEGWLFGEVVEGKWVWYGVLRSSGLALARFEKALSNKRRVCQRLYFPNLNGNLSTCIWLLLRLIWAQTTMAKG